MFNILLNLTLLMGVWAFLLSCHSAGFSSGGQTQPVVATLSPAPQNSLITDTFRPKNGLTYRKIDLVMIIDPGLGSYIGPDGTMHSMATGKIVSATATQKVVASANKFTNAMFDIEQQAFRTGAITKRILRYIVFGAGIVISGRDKDKDPTNVYDEEAEFNVIKAPIVGEQGLDKVLSILQHQADNQLRVRMDAIKHFVIVSVTDAGYGGKGLASAAFLAKARPLIPVVGEFHVNVVVGLGNESTPCEYRVQAGNEYQRVAQDPQVGGAVVNLCGDFDGAFSQIATKIQGSVQDQGLILSRIPENSYDIQVRLNGQPVAYQYNAAKNSIEITGKKPANSDTIEATYLPKP